MSREKLRCGICDHVSDRSIETNIEDYTSELFFPDPKSPQHYVCDSCYSVINETVEELSYVDLD